MTIEIKKGMATSYLNLTPLIDVVFLLLIFFLVATRLAEEDRELDVLLPTASEAMPMTVAPSQIIVNIDEQGNYFVENARLSLDELDRVIQRAAVNNPLQQSINIRADKRVALDYVIQALNVCKKYGIEDYTFDADE